VLCRHSSNPFSKKKKILSGIQCDANGKSGLASAPVSLDLLFCSEDKTGVRKGDEENKPQREYDSSAFIGIELVLTHTLHESLRETLSSARSALVYCTTRKESQK
jgi:hypothetical protein